MDTKFLSRQRPPSQHLDDRTVVADWVASLATFYDSYHQVAACLHGEPGINSGYPPETLMALRMSMEAELQLLFQDMDRSPHTSAHEKPFNQKLATHTKHLTHLNQQAFLLLVDLFPK
ncbi:hypothetical protein GO755_27555 [Spirosoma sp. HMF4905]|uniref:Uncharacterized protein n=1 Tax=Spirosoma arboris TaxID=2682092 RepID=A0A7K1SJ80_9BACT|nr:hypothetical protein [Spirosoma arboris]MVM33825.1 hypothetical protein [Spirosoma arboris]